MSKVCLVAVDIRSAHNVGSLFRTCDGFGASLVLVGICPRPTGSSDDDRLPHIAQKAQKDISKTAIGAESTVEWEYFATFEGAKQYLQNRNYKIVAIDQSDESKPIKSLSRLNPDSDKLALVVGSEIDGLSRATLSLCDETYEIPMKGSKESFNVSVAAGIALYQATKK